MKIEKIDIRFYKSPVAVNSHIHTRTRLDGEITATIQPLSAVEHTCLSFHITSFVYGSSKQCYLQVVVLHFFILSSY